MNGLGTPQVDTRNGLFANEGYGGGVFNYNTAFGGVASEAVPKNFSRLGANTVPRPRNFSRLGNIDHEAIPRNFSSLGQDDPRFPWLSYSDDTLAMQTVLNQEIRNVGGLCPITVDGYLGPQTCGAVDWSRDFTSRPGISTCDSHRPAGGFPYPQNPPCPGLTASPEAQYPDPTPIQPTTTTSTSPSSLPAEIEPEVEEKSGGMNAGIIVGGLLLLGLAGVVAVAGRKK